MKIFGGTSSIAPVRSCQVPRKATALEAHHVADANDFAHFHGNPQPGLRCSMEYINDPKNDL